MDDKILTAIIAGSISLVVSLIGFLSSWIALQAKKNEIERNLKNSYMERLYEMRLKNYPKALEITKYVTRLPKKESSFNREDILAIRDSLGEWLNGEGGLVASEELINALYEVRDRLSADYGGDQEYSRQQMEKIVSVISNFRRELRADIRFLHASDESRIRDIG